MSTGYRRMGAWSKKIYDIGFMRLSTVPFHSVGFMLRQIPHLLRLRSYESVWGMVSRFIKDDRLRRAFSIQPLLVGGNPFDTTAIYGMINHLERTHGIWFPKGGTGALVDALETLMREEGIRISLNTTLDRIRVEDGRATGVVLDGGHALDADVVVSNMDPVHVYRHMLPDDLPSPVAKLRSKHGRLSMGLYVLFFGANRTWPEVAHHTVWFGERYKSLLGDIFHKKVLAEDFSLYVHRPTATDPSFAPEGCDSFYVLCPVPNLAGGQDWSVEGPKLRDRIVKALDATMLPGLTDHITAEFAMTPEDFKSDYLSVDGAGSRCRRSSRNRRGSGSTTGPRAWTGSISWARARIPARGCRAWCPRPRSSTRWCQSRCRSNDPGRGDGTPRAQFRPGRKAAAAHGPRTHGAALRAVPNGRRSGRHHRRPGGRGAARCGWRALDDAQDSDPLAVRGAGALCGPARGPCGLSAPRRNGGAGHRRHANRG